MQQLTTPLDLLLRRSAIVQAMRQHFWQQEFIEVDTPICLSAPAPEVHIEGIAVDIDLGSSQERRYLQTSPELPMKRILAKGFSRIFQIAATFRAGDFSASHRPEFRMLEWYRANAGWHTLLDDCEALIRSCARAAGHDSLVFKVGEKTIDLNPPFQRITMEQAFVRYAGFSLLDALDCAALEHRLREHHIHFQPGEAWDDLFHRVFVGIVEPALCQSGQPLFLTDYPAPLAALARRNPADPRLAERFELYIGGLELANGYGELTDPVEQRQRFIADDATRQAAGKHAYPIDEYFFASLSHLPACAGIALGVDRLIMVLCDVSDIDDVAFIPWTQA